eukprot:jgi/Ulvmu1/10915/UM007_0093.1
MHSEGNVRRQTNGHLDSDLIRHLGWLLQDDPEPASARVHVDTAPLLRRVDIPPVQLFSHTPAVSAVQPKPELFEHTAPSLIAPHGISPLGPSNSCVLPLVARRDSSGSDVRPMARQMSLPSSAEAVGGTNSRSATSQERLERIREKNRRASTRFREKQKREREEMAARVDELQSRIHASKNHREELQRRRTVLASRSATAASCLCVLRETFHDVCRAARPHATSVSTPGRLFQPPAEPLRPLDDYADHAPLTLGAVLGSLQADGASVADSFTRSVQHTKSTAASQLELEPGSVCWHVQSVYEVAEGCPLSFSSALASLECIASVQLQRHAMLLEMAFLQAAQHHSSMRPPSFQVSHSLDDPEASPAQTQPWPAVPADDASLFSAAIPPAAVDALRARCGVRETVPLTSAVEHIFRRLLRTYLPRMPFAAWRAVCTKMLRLLHTHYGEPLCAELPAALRPVEDDQGAEGGCGSDRADEGLHHLLLALAQITAATLRAELQAGDSSSRPGPQADGNAAASAALAERCSQLQYMSALAAAETSAHAPVLSRQLTMHAASASALPLPKAEGVMMRSFQSIAAPAKHKAALARIWEQWLQRRADLDRPLHMTLCMLEALPTATSMRVPLDDLAATPDAAAPEAARSRAQRAHAGDGSPPSKLMRSASAAAVAEAAAAAAAAAAASLPPLLGQDAATTATAAAAMEQAAAVHESDRQLQAEHVAMLALPSPFLAIQHHQAIWGLLMDNRMLVFDHLHLCRVAADEQRHSMLFKPVPNSILPRPQ